MKSEVPSNARELEYKVVKDFSYKTLAATDMDPETFKYMVRVNISNDFISPTIKPNGWWKHGDIDIASELLRLGFIEEVVDDPVVKVGDKFKHSNGDYYIFSMVGNYFFALVCLESGNRYDNPKEICKGVTDSFKLSEIVDPDIAHHFTPCKIEIREVEE